MRLTAYMDEMGETAADIAKRAGVSYRTVERVAKGLSAHGTSLSAIVAATKQRPTRSGGFVDFADLLPTQPKTGERAA